MPRPSQRFVGSHPYVVLPSSFQDRLLHGPTSETPPASPVSNPLNDASPFQEHLDTNYIPSCEDISELRTLTGAQQAIQAGLDEEIARLKEQASRLEEEKRPITHFIQSHNILMHPFRRLPLEVLQEIFFHCSSVNILGSMHPALAPIVLVAVCQLWRRVAMCTPTLWTRIHIPLGSPSIETDEEFSRHLVDIDNWLSRSGSLPLAISVIQVGIDSPGQWRYPPTRASYVFNVLYRHVSRWGQLHIRGNTTVAQPFVDVPHTELVALRSIHFDGLPRHNYPTSGIATMIDSPPADSTLFSPKFFSAPELREITTVSTFRLVEPRRFIPFPGTCWANITSLTLGAAVPVLDLSEFLLLFGPTNVLENVSVEIGSYYTRSAPVPPSSDFRTVEFPCLKRLAYCEQVNGFSWFGEAIRCPVLEQLECHPYPVQRLQILPSITPHGPPGPPPLLQLDNKGDTSFLSLMSHSGTAIQYLTFDPKPYSPVEMLRCLASCPNLRSLTLVKSRNTRPRRTCGNYRPPVEPPLLFFDKAFLQALVTPLGILEGDVRLCPRLSAFECDAYEVSFTLEDFVEFLRVKQSRSVEGTEKLRECVVSFGSTVTKDQELYDEAISLVENGTLNAHLLFNEPMVPRTSIRDGLRNGWAQRSWYSSHVDTFINGFV